MSFILEALRKSEQERQRQAGPGFAELRPAMTRPSFPAWAVALGVLLAINLLVLAIVMLRRDDASAPAASNSAASLPRPDPAAAAPAPVRTELPSERYSADDRASLEDTARGAGDEYSIAPEELAEAAPAEAEPELQPPPRASSSDGESDPRLPTINDPALQGANLPEMHLDIHVYATQPAERFVFLNNRKYREGDETPEGTTIERITRDGVVLSHRGVRFLMPRQ